ncbi:MAG: helix-turn-helix domain-containing protein [Candidatus Riflebacteria bacterium]
MTAKCLNEEQLIDLYYGENASSEARLHLAECEVCQALFHQLCEDLVNIDSPMPDAGFKAVEEALKILDLREKRSEDDEILTPEEVADWFKVTRHNVMSMLHLLPHFIVDGQIRFERSALKTYLKGQYSGAASKAPDQPRQTIISLVSRKAV